MAMFPRFVQNRWQRGHILSPKTPSPVIAGFVVPVYQHYFFRLKRGITEQFQRQGEAREARTREEEVALFG